MSTYNKKFVKVLISGSVAMIAAGILVAIRGGLIHW